MPLSSFPLTSHSPLHLSHSPRKMDCSLKILSDLSILSVFQGTSVPPLFDTDPSPSYFRLLLAATTPLEWSSLRVALEHHFGSVDNVQRSAVYSGWLGVEMVVEAFRRLDQRAAGEYEVRRWLAALWMAVVQQRYVLAASTVD